MILKIDHIGYASKDINKELELFTLLKYKIYFSNKDLPNPYNKRNLMHNYKKYHDVFYLISDISIPVEIIDYHTTSNKRSYITPVFENINDNYFDKGKIVKIGKEFFIQSNVISLDVDALILYNNNRFIFNKVIVRTPDICKSIEFWKLFGFKTLIEGDEFCVLEFEPILKSHKLLIYLHLCKELNCCYFLDDKGFNCIAFISTSIKNEKNILTNKGIEATEITNIVVNSKSLNIFFVTGPSGEKVEIIGIDN